MKNLKNLIGIIALFALLTSCSSDSTSSTNTMKISGKATYTAGAARTSNASSPNAGVVLTSFKINIKEIEFKVNESEGNENENHNGDDHGSGDDNHDGLFNGEDEAGLNGPWEIDLLNQTAPVTTVTIANGTYEQVELKLGKSLVTTSPLYNKTAKIEGTINSVPFVFWHDFGQKIEIDYSNPAQNLVVSNSSFDLVFNIDLNQVLSQVDLTSAVDGNGNGVIEIGPDDTDGNNALAEQLNTHIHDSSHMEDHNHHH